MELTGQGSSANRPRASSAQISENGAPLGEHDETSSGISKQKLEVEANCSHGGPPAILGLLDRNTGKEERSVLPIPHLSDSICILNRQVLRADWKWSFQPSRFRAKSERINLEPKDNIQHS